MGTLEKILNILKMKNEPKSYSVKFYAEMKLDDGRIIATEDEQFMIGSKVFAISDDGEASPLEAGSYTMENGNKLTIGENSEVLDMGEEAEAEDVEETEAKAEEEEMSEEVVEEAKEEMSEEVEEVKEEVEEVEEAVNPLAAELEETKAALDTVRAELNEVNLLNSKLLYVNRIFKANQLDESQKLRVVETLDKAGTVKEAKLIYETIKDTFNVAKSKKESFKNKTKSLKEGIGMASKSAGTSTAPKKEVIAESSNMVNRFQKLANITINE